MPDVILRERNRSHGTYDVLTFAAALLANDVTLYHRDESRDPYDVQLRPAVSWVSQESLPPGTIAIVLGEDCCCEEGPVCCPDVPETLYLTISGCNNPDQGDMDGTYTMTYDAGLFIWTAAGLPSPCFGTVEFSCVDGVYALAVTEGTLQTGVTPSPAVAVSCEPFLWTGTLLHTPAGPPYEGDACCVGDTLTWTVSE